MILLNKTEFKQQLAAVYSAADVFFNPTVEDNYPTVNLEAEACGIPVITYDTGGCGETLFSDLSHVARDFEEVLGALTGTVFDSSAWMEQDAR